MEPIAISRRSEAMASLRIDRNFAKHRQLMSLHEDEAWLQQGEEQHRLEGNCSIGRAALNTLVVDSPKVSRLHSIIHLEENGAFWLIDLGSSNGTFLNNRRIHEPIRLHDQDEINIGGRAFIFHQPGGKSSAELRANAVVTVQEVENIDCWLLVADIKNFTPLSRSMSSGDLATLVSAWLGSCKEIIERHRGTVNKYLGDGLLAFWRDESNAAADVASTIKALKAAQESDEPPFRFVVHFGAVAVAGMPSTREETLMGSEVNLVFRLEKVLATLAEARGVTEAARSKLGEAIPCRLLGEYELKGFELKRALFAI
jgi:adenylate cyclase